MGVNSLPKIVIRQRRSCDLNPGPDAPESSTLTTGLPSHPDVITKEINRSTTQSFWQPTGERRRGSFTTTTYSLNLLQTGGRANRQADRRTDRETDRRHSVTETAVKTDRQVGRHCSVTETAV